MVTMLVMRYYKNSTRTLLGCSLDVNSSSRKKSNFQKKKKKSSYFIKEQKNYSRALPEKSRSEVIEVLKNSLRNLKEGHHEHWKTA
jgi:hypothetical protein